MTLSPELLTDLDLIRSHSPLVHNITNFVVMNNTANALLALGASPVMAHAVEEAADMARMAGALAVNIGTLSSPWVEAMDAAMRAAAEAGVPIVFDPVGVGATAFRNTTAERLLRQTRPTILRGNGSEIRTVASLFGLEQATRTKGVDSTAASDTAIAAAQALAEHLDAVVVISGQTDFVVSRQAVLENHLGTPMMERVTGMGCTATAVCGAFAAVNPDPAAAALHAMTVMGYCGERALEQASGPGSFQVAFLDALYACGRSQA